MNYSPITGNGSDGQAGATSALVDAYMHIGVPRFGSPEHIFHALDTNGVSHAAVVLGPLVPDLSSLFEAMRQRPDRIRGIGIPFGADADQRMELMRAQVRAGVLGMRLSHGECQATPGIAELLGEEGRCIYALSPIASTEAAEFFLLWLSKYPDSFIAAPHFLIPGFSWQDRTKLDSASLELLRHPRFYAILSRQGGNGTVQPYPYPDYLPWVEFVLLHCGWDRILWGSEFPVHLWRNETYSDCVHWLPALLNGADEGKLQAFHAGNANRLLFQAPPAMSEDIAIPGWLEGQFDEVRNRTVPLIQNNTLDLPGDLYYSLLDAYLNSSDFPEGRPFNEYFINQLQVILKTR